MEGMSNIENNTALKFYCKSCNPGYAKSKELGSVNMGSCQRQASRVGTQINNVFTFFNSLSDPGMKNILVAVSCDKKNRDAFTKSCAKQVLAYASSFTSGRIGIFIADEVMKYNMLAADESCRKSLREALAYGDYFMQFFKEVVGEMDAQLHGRCVIMRCSDLYTVEHDQQVQRVKAAYEDSEMKERTDTAATQLFKWRCASTPNARRMGFIREFMFHEMPMIGNWEPTILRNVEYHGMIYPAVNPRGMSVVASTAATYDRIFGSPTQGRLLIVLHIGRDGCEADVEQGEADVERYFRSNLKMQDAFSEEIGRRKSTQPFP
eukprot:gnl/MRDRNA2_/MRDRNA2_84017_c0_seq1.p1 gnl/MRDRNA2_/MRDRNA2_84017_c0~~gnl/MRDRNA2_/MRDRNA2_84017_c0_seq1.p1  ORF type:complete len:321 (+),score=46.08 gnl/MRDRNA2_/MRDRNA2_84017_c0_seq1:71-1033(+)